MSGDPVGRVAESAPCCSREFPHRQEDLPVTLGAGLHWVAIAVGDGRMIFPSVDRISDVLRSDDPALD